MVDLACEPSTASKKPSGLTAFDGNGVLVRQNDEFDDDESGKTKRRCELVSDGKREVDAGVGEKTAVHLHDNGDGVGERDGDRREDDGGRDVKDFHGVIEDVGTGIKSVSDGNRRGKVGLMGSVAAAVIIGHVRCSKGADGSKGVVVRRCWEFKQGVVKNPRADIPQRILGQIGRRGGKQKLIPNRQSNFSRLLRRLLMSPGHHWVVEYLVNSSPSTTRCRFIQAQPIHFIPLTSCFFVCLLQRRLLLPRPLRRVCQSAVARRCGQFSMVSGTSPTRSSSQDFCCFHSRRGPSCTSRRCI